MENSLQKKLWNTGDFQSVGLKCGVARRKKDAKYHEKTFAKMEYVMEINVDQRS